MAVMKEWKCAAHGHFEGTHPICPALNCSSDRVERAFVTPVSISKGRYASFERGMRNTAERMGISDFRSARAGDVSFAGRGQDAPLGTEVLWGNEVARHPGMGGRTFANLTQQAAQPLTVAGVDPEVDPYLSINNGMRAAATTLGVTKRVLPPAELTGELKPTRSAA
jgi:hypothetical protein